MFHGAPEAASPRERSSGLRSEQRSQRLFGQVAIAQEPTLGAGRLGRPQSGSRGICTEVLPIKEIR
jgi:hypothetical protein